MVRPPPSSSSFSSHRLLLVKLYNRNKSLQRNLILDFNYFFFVKFMNVMNIVNDLIQVSDTNLNRKNKLNMIFYCNEFNV